MHFGSISCIIIFITLIESQLHFSIQPKNFGVNDKWILRSKWTKFCFDTKRTNKNNSEKITFNSLETQKPYVNSWKIMGDSLVTSPWTSRVLSLWLSAHLRERLTSRATWALDKGLSPTFNSSKSFEVFPLGSNAQRIMLSSVIVTGLLI